LTALGDELAVIAVTDVRAVVSPQPRPSAPATTSRNSSRTAPGQTAAGAISSTSWICACGHAAVVRLPQRYRCRPGPARRPAASWSRSCDLAVASSAADFATPAQYRLFCSTPMGRIVAQCGAQARDEMLLTGRRSQPRKPPHRLVNRVASPEPSRRGAALARKIAEVHACRKIARKVLPSARNGLDDAYCLAAETMVKNMMARDAEEGIRAFMRNAPRGGRSVMSDA